MLTTYSSSAAKCDMLSDNDIVGPTTRTSTSRQQRLEDENADMIKAWVKGGRSRHHQTAETSTTMVQQGATKTARHEDAYKDEKDKAQRTTADLTTTTTKVTSCLKKTGGAGAEMLNLDISNGTKRDYMA